MTHRRNVIVNLATSADGYIARPDGDLEWLTSRPKPKGFYGMGEFMKSVDTKLLGPEDVRGGTAHGWDVRFEKSVPRVFSSSATS